MTLDDCNPYSNYSIKCETTFTTISGKDRAAAEESEAEKYFNSLAFAGAAALAGLSGLAIYAARKRRVARINLAQEEERAEGQFEMMADSSVQA